MRDKRDQQTKELPGVAPVIAHGKTGKIRFFRGYPFRKARLTEQGFRRLHLTASAHSR